MKKRLLFLLCIPYLLLALCASACAAAEDGQRMPEPVEAGTHDVSYYYASMQCSLMRIDSSILIADPLGDCAHISMLLSYPLGFPNDEIDHFVAYVGEEAYPLSCVEGVPLACAAPSVFSGLIPAGEVLGTLRLVPVGKAEMEEWSALTVYFSDYEKME